MIRNALIAVGMASIICAQAPIVVATSPTANGFTGPFERIEVQFAAPISAATVTSHSFAVFGQWTGAVEGTITLDASQTVASFQPNKPMFVGDAIQVSLSRDILSTTGAPLAGGYHFQLIVRSAPGSGTFQLTEQIPFRMPGEGWIATYGIFAGDIDRDGSPDITAINERSHDLRVFKNDGCGNFGPMTLVSDGNNWPSPHHGADFNRDGWLDLTTGDYTVGNLSVFLNDGQGSYLPPFNLSGGNFIRGVVTGDFDGDGWPDIAAGNGWTTLVWLNDGTGDFRPPVGYTNSQNNSNAEINVVDANGDGHLDLVMASTGTQHAYVLIGNGDGTFTPDNQWVSIGGSPQASASADINGDGHIDVCYACRNPDSFRWLLGDGAGGLVTGGSLPAGGYPTSVHLTDIDGDGDIDASVSSYIGDDFRVYFNDGTGNFASPLILPAAGGGGCTTLVDYDRDGDIDIIAADEISDIGMVFTQTNTVVTGIQQPSCLATLRVDQRSAGDGFGNRPAVPVRIGSKTALSMSGVAGSYGAIAIGFPAATAVPIANWGLTSFEQTIPIVVITYSPLDLRGELVTALDVPISIPAGITLMAQGLMLAPGTQLLTNPVKFILVPS